VSMWRSTFSGNIQFVEFLNVLMMVVKRERRRRQGVKDVKPKFELLQSKSVLKDNSQIRVTMRNFDCV